MPEVAMVPSRSAGALMLAVAVLVPAGCASTGSTSEGGDGSSPPPASPSASPTDSVAVEDIRDIEGVLSIPAEPFADWVSAQDGCVWVANVNEGLVCFAPDGAVRAAVPTGSIDLAMEQGFGALWAGADAGPDGGELVRVDLADAANVLRIPVPPLAEESSIAVTDDAVWLLGSDGDLVKVDPATNAVAASVPAPDGAFALRGGFGALWVSLGGATQVARLDPASADVITSIEAGVGAGFMAIGADAVWVMNQDDGSVSRIDPDTNSVTATIDGLGFIQGGDIAATDDSVWVRTTRDLAVEIDPATDEVVRRIGPSQGSGSIAISPDGSVWISAHDVNLVHRIP